MLFIIRLYLIPLLLFFCLSLQGKDAETSCSKKIIEYHSSFQNQLNSKSTKLSKLYQEISNYYHSTKCSSATIYYNKISFDYYLYTKKMDSATAYGEKVASFVQQANNNPFPDFYFKYSSLHISHHQIDSAEIYALKALKQFQKKGLKSKITSTYRLLSYIYLRKANNRLFNRYYSLAIQQVDTNRASKELGLLYTYNGYKNFEEGNFDIALGFALKALKIFEKINDTEYIIVSYNRIAILMGEMHLLEDAILYLKKGLALAKLENNKQLEGVFCNNIGIAYTEMGLYSSAMTFLQESLKIFTAENDVLGLVTCHEAIGNAYCLEKKYVLATQAYNEGIRLAKSIGSNKSLAPLLIDLGKVNVKMNQLNVAKQNLKNTYAIANPLDLKDYLMEYYLTMSSVFEQEKKLDSAYFYHKKGQAIKEKIEGSDTKNLIKQLKVKFEADLKEVENQKLQIKLANNKSRNFYLILLSFLLAITLLTTSVVFIYRARIKQLVLHKNMQRINHFKHIISEKNELINTLKLETEDKDLNLSKKITEKLLVEQNWMEFMIEFEKLFPNFFSSIQKKNPTLTKNDLRFIALLKLNLSDKEIAGLLNLENDTVRKTKYRIRNKVGTDENILNILNN